MSTGKIKYNVITLCGSIKFKTEFIKVQEELVTILDKIGRLYAPKSMLKFTQKGLDYLVSAEMVTVEKNKVGFVHQSILDYFVSEKMVNQY